VSEVTDVPIVSMRAGERSPRGLLEAAGAAYAAGRAPAVGRLYERGQSAAAPA
jgi:hypothetical protein